VVAHFDDENRRGPIGFGLGVDLEEQGSRERSIFDSSLSQMHYSKLLVFVTRYRFLLRR
jgi:hypothetical protein